MNYKSFAIRALIAFVFGPLIVLAALEGGLIWLGFVLLVVLLSVKEFYDLTEKKSSPHYPFSLMISFFVVVSFYFYGEHALLPFLILFLIGLLFIEIYRKKESPLLNVSTTVYGSLLYSILFGSFVLLREMPRAYGLDPTPAGKWIAMIILSTWICDTAAYLIGSYFGKHKLIERISPNKTIEGTIGGFVFSILTAYVFYLLFINELRVADSLIIGAIVGSVGQYGDLFESMFKRDVGVKDSSSIIPEHGGIMDRFDSLTFSAPVVYLYLRFFYF